MDAYTRMGPCTLECGALVDPSRSVCGTSLRGTRVELKRAMRQAVSSGVVHHPQHIVRFRCQKKRLSCLLKLLQQARMVSTKVP